MRQQTPKGSSKFRSSFEESQQKEGRFSGCLRPGNSGCTWAERGSCLQPLDVYDRSVFSDDTSENMLTVCLGRAVGQVSSWFHISAVAQKCFLRCSGGLVGKPTFVLYVIPNINVKIFISFARRCDCV